MLLWLTWVDAPPLAQKTRFPPPARPLHSPLRSSRTLPGANRSRSGPRFEYQAATSSLKVGRRRSIKAQAKNKN